MIAPPPLPKFLAAERLILAMIVSAAFHSLMLLGITYHSGLGGGLHVGQDFAGADPFQVRIDPLPAPPSDDAILVTQSDSPTTLPPPAAPPPRQQNAAAQPAPGPESYFRAGDLEVRPQIMDRVTPAYPEGAAHLTGKVVVKIMISASGTVDEVMVLRAEPPGIFEASAISAFSAARFTPGMKGQKPVKSMVVLEVNYDTVERQNAQTGAR
jgi:TonB family protein